MVGSRVRRRLRLAARAVTAGVGLVIITTCAVPVFDLDTSLAYRTAARMEKITTVGPLVVESHDVTDGREFYFIPSVSAFPDTGALVVIDGLEGRLRYFAPDPLTGTIFGLGDKGYGREGVRPVELDLLVSPLTSPTAPYGDAFFVAHREAGALTIESFRIDLSLPNLVLPNDIDLTLEPLTDLSVNDAPIGVALDISDTTPGDDTLAIFSGATVSPGELFLEKAAITDTFPAPAVTPAGSVSIPGGELPTAATFAYSTDRDTYAVSRWMEGERYSTFTRDSGGTVTTLNTDKRIDAILSDGRLYHRGERDDLVFSAAGELELTIPAGSLRFAWETRDTPKEMIYTIAYFMPSGDDDDGVEVFVDVYAIRTSELETLQ